MHRLCIRCTRPQPGSSSRSGRSAASCTHGAIRCGTCGVPSSSIAEGSQPHRLSRGPSAAGGARSEPPTDMGEPGLAPRDLVLGRLRRGVRDLFPGYFALVMATGIISTAVGADGSAGLSAALLVLSIICYLVLIVLYCW